ncbi:uncharacterized protein LOC123292627 [Chrysoperla carnea]|uniref:uncharacterized protein LOC123292627 n=1 Tax=Chrysoperla carnea TaxID=189513 RepID=UPI001D09982D|nr:uncharacterized protein LOC123292627 [Chrysoperla carnea]
MAEITGTTSLKIKDLKIPDVIEYGTMDELTLDCDYDIDKDANGLVVKWFFDDTQQIYQWIPKNKPQDSGLLKGKIDLKYKASNDSNKMYRALHIKDVNPQLTGNYTCVVSTFDDEVRESKRMVIFDKQDEFNLTFDNVDDNTIKITCSATNIYPKPNITINASRPDVSSEVENATLGEDQLWKISTSMLVAVNNQHPETFVCELNIPEAKYSVRKELYYSSQETTEITSSSSEMSLQKADDNSAYGYGGGNWLTASTPLVVIFVSLRILLDLI